jgi:hypothetical protein
MLGEPRRDEPRGWWRPRASAWARAAVAVLDVGEEDVPDEPAPAASTAARRISVGCAQRQALLIARRGSGRDQARLGRGSLGAHGVVARQHAEVARTRCRRDAGTEAQSRTSKSWGSSRMARVPQFWVRTLTHRCGLECPAASSSALGHISRCGSNGHAATVARRACVLLSTAREACETKTDVNLAADGGEEQRAHRYGSLRSPTTIRVRARFARK